MSAPAPAVTGLPVPALTVRTTAISDPGDLLDLLPTSDGVATWVRRGDGMVAWGEAARTDTAGSARMVDADAWFTQLRRAADVRDDVAVPGSGLVAFGAFAFDDGDPAGGSLVVPRILVGRRAGVSWVTTIDPEGAAPLTLDGPRDALTFPTDVTYAAGAATPAEWKAKVADAVARIRAGEAAKIVLARDVWATSATPLDTRALVTRFADAYPTTWAFAVDGLVGATPEMLVRRERRLVASRVLAGTIRRTGDDERDLAHAAALARSSKDLEEHEFAVESLARALAPFVESANVPEVPSVLHLPNVMHLATDVTAVLQRGPDGDRPSSLRLAASLHPTAAVGGTPTLDAVRLVREIEGMDRGRYAGPVGWIGSDGDGEWCIALRCGALDPDDPHRIRLFAGCGIVAASDPGAELDETEAKLEPVRQALLG
ncbi:isochorismate synthase [Serinibacter arcticus]|uniref:isochorismate synthase n=1 Tax=Serinibacter arcticus TaxID=1655435 RepID=A0A2U1ZUB2_9MICO|nr:isochorismate synthase [Serinibacter arcticus]PWD50549.1 isochorismate synthase [Serinibacter arcticus]